MRKTCGKIVQSTRGNMGMGCDQVSTVEHSQQNPTTIDSGYTSFVHQSADHLYTGISTAIIFTRYLLRWHLYALSPAPITTTTNEKERK